MRADRLVAILMLLQTRGQVTAADVAEELEVSERTARRDLEALGMAGLPVYSMQGRNGGWRLAGGGRTDLTGLTSAEARALFMVAGPASSATPEVKAALRKLVRALPEQFRTDAERASGATHIDAAGWFRSDSGRPTPDHLDALQSAVIESEELNIDYVARDAAATSRVVQPLGLVAKGNNWYLVAQTDRGLRSFRVDRIRSAQRLGRRFAPPERFDLAATWRAMSESFTRELAPIVVNARCLPGMVGVVRAFMGGRVAIGPTGDDGRVHMELSGMSVRSLAGQIAGFGRALEVVDHREMTEALLDIAEELRSMYVNQD
ncbi:MAG: helix-turn-helix transcriptional regulator [Acidimicrobiia bacterium]